MSVYCANMARVGEVGWGILSIILGVIAFVVLASMAIHFALIMTIAMGENEWEKRKRNYEGASGARQHRIQSHRV